MTRVFDSFPLNSTNVQVQNLWLLVHRIGNVKPILWPYNLLLEACNWKSQHLHGASQKESIFGMMHLLDKSKMFWSIKYSSAIGLSKFSFKDLESIYGSLGATWIQLWVGLKTYNYRPTRPPHLDPKWISKWPLRRNPSILGVRTDDDHHNG